MNRPTRGEQKAIELLEALQVEDLPVRVQEIALSLGAEITYEPYEGDVSGMLYRTDDKAVIGVNSRHPGTRQRFTIAHEIGHLRMHKGTTMFIDRFVRVNWRDGASNQQEVEANSFAAELLMPRKLVERQIQRALDERTSVTAQRLAASLAKSFAVSPEAMQYRLANLGILDPSALIG